MIDKNEKPAKILPISRKFYKFLPMTMTNMVEEKTKDREMILHPWLPKKGFAFIYAAAGVGKSHFAMNCAYAIARGGDFLSYSCPEPKNVLYLDGEMSYQDLHARLHALQEQQGPLEGGQMYILTPDKIAPDTMPKICSGDGQAYYREQIENLNIDVLVIDNLSTLSNIDESRVEQWLIVQNWILQLKTAGVSVIIVHHSGKDPTSYRGTSKMLDCADTAISLQKMFTLNYKTAEETLHFMIEYQKNRSFFGNDAISLEVLFKNGIWTWKSIEVSKLEYIAECVKVKMSHQEIAYELKTSRPYVTKMVKKARDKGLLPEKE